MAFCSGFNVIEPNQFDDLEVVTLKTKHFQSEIHRGQDCIKNLILNIFSIAKEAKERIRRIKSIYSKYYLTKEQKSKLIKGKTSPSCGRCYSSDNIPHLDHDYFLGGRNNPSSKNNEPMTYGYI